MCGEEIHTQNTIAHTFHAHRQSVPTSSKAFSPNQDNISISVILLQYSTFLWLFIDKTIEREK